MKPALRRGKEAYADLLRLIVDQPGTTQELAARHNIGINPLRKVLRVMSRMGIVQEIAWRKYGRGPIYQPVWGFTGPPAPHPGRRRALAYAKPKASLIAFCRAVRVLMECSSTAAELGEDAGMSRGRARVLLKHMHEVSRLVFISHWGRHLSPGGVPLPEFRFGVDQPSKLRPRPKAPDIAWAKYSQMRAQRMAHARLVFITAGRQFPGSAIHHEERNA